VGEVLLMLFLVRILMRRNCRGGYRIFSYIHKSFNPLKKGGVNHHTNIEYL
jgi:hypothetical protein